MTWTAKQARYNTGTQVVVREDGRLTKHYVLTQHGAVARTFVTGSFLVEVALLRRGNKHAQYQGCITRDGDLYMATTPAGERVAACAHYIDAEAALLPRRNRRRAWGDYAWPITITAALHAPKFEQCQVCGWEVRGGECTRPDLHWDFSTELDGPEAAPADLAPAPAVHTARRAPRVARRLTVCA